MNIQNTQPKYSLYSLLPKDQSRGQLFSERRSLLANWCASIEKSSIHQNIKTPIFAGFQQLSYFLPVMERYQRLAKATHDIWIFGQPDKPMPEIDKVHYVHLQADDALCKEWFLVVYQEQYARALVAKEITKQGTPHKDRMFEGAIVNHSGIIEKLHQSLSEVIATKRVNK